MKILFMMPYPLGEAPSQRFRIEQYFDLLRSKNIDFDTAPFLNRQAYHTLYQPGNTLKKIWAIATGYFKRFLSLLSMGQYDYVFLHREATPLGPPVIEWLMIKVLHKKVIYDFDDAIWLPNVSESNRLFARVKWFGKVRRICKWAYKISCGNEYLYDYARRFSSKVILNHTVVDTDRQHNKIKNQDTDKFVIGWTGSHSTSKYLAMIVPVLKELEADLDFELRIISNRPPYLDLKTYRFIPWNKSTEIDDLLAFNIGIMPLTDDIWSKGKCGFKAIQYMALGIPALVSPIAINKKIVDDGVNGFYCTTKEEWKENIMLLMKDEKLRKKMGLAARKKIVDQFSVASNSSNFLALFT